MLISKDFFAAGTKQSRRRGRTGPLHNGCSTSPQWRVRYCAHIGLAFPRLILSTTAASCQHGFGCDFSCFIPAGGQSTAGAGGEAEKDNTKGASDGDDVAKEPVKQKERNSGGGEETYKGAHPPLQHLN